MRMKTIAVLALLALGASAALVACGSDDGSSDSGKSARDGYAGATAGEDTTQRKPRVETIVIRDGAPVGGVAELKFDAGDQIRFRVSSNVADEVHVHGYDIEEEVPAGGTATLTFPADIEGIFEVELHESEEQIAELRVEP